MSDIEKTEMTRDGFQIPTDEHSILQRTAIKLGMLGYRASKTDVIRMAFSALEHMSDKELKEAMETLPPIKRGRPTKK